MTTKKKSSKPRRFTCAGCSKTITPDGTPETSRFVWRDRTTNKPSTYCHECDDRLIQDVPLPCPKKGRT